MGLMDAVLEQVKPEVPVPRPFLIRSGIDHEIFYDVRHFHSPTVIIFITHKFDSIPSCQKIRG